MPLIIKNNYEFEYRDQKYEIKQVNNIDDLSHALRIMSLLRLCTDTTHEADAATQHLSELYETQKNYVADYVEQIGGFDAERVKKNIEYLLNQNNIKLGAFESYVLRISSGYLSRSLGHDSPKNISINKMWKLSRILNVSLDALMNEDLTAGGNNTGIVQDFVDKLFTQTVSGEMVWEVYKNDLPDDDPLSFNGELVRKAGLFIVRDSKGHSSYSYCTADRKSLSNLSLAGKVVKAVEMEPGMDMIIVPYRRFSVNNTYFDFLTLKYMDSIERYKVTRLFTTEDDESQAIDKAVSDLYRKIMDSIKDIKITTDAKDFISNYLQRR